MRTLYKIMVCSLLPLWLYSQQTAFFETTIYFEDAVGNVDSVVVGMDEDANYEYNPQFGEADIEAPWDSVFEVRAAHTLPIGNDNLVLSKKIIASTEGGIHPTLNCILLAEAIELYYYAKYLPVTVRWDRSAFADSFCRVGSILSLNYLPELVEQWWVGLEPGSQYSCMAEDSSFITDPANDGTFNISMMDEVEGIGEDTIHALLLNYRFQNAIDTPCDATVVFTSEPEEAPHEGAILFPNPTRGLLYMQEGYERGYEMYSSQGQLLEQGFGQQIDLSAYPNGVYFLRMREGTHYWVEKVLKLD